MKAYSFSFNASDWLASPAVRMMSKAERGVYINLLALAWEAPRQGTLPASSEKVRRLADMSADEWAESGDTLLEKFPLSECGGYRYNPRLVLEAERQEAKRETNAEAGRRSAEKRAAEKLAKDSAAKPLQRNGNENPTGVENNATNAQRNGNENPTISKVKLSTTEVVVVVVAHEAAAATADLKVKLTAKQIAALNTDPADLQPVTDCPLTKPLALAAIFREAGYPDADPTRYAMQIAAKSEGMNLTAPQWKSRIINFLNNDAAGAHGIMRAPGAGQTPNEVPTNWPKEKPYVAPIGMGIPSMKSLLKPDYLPK